MPPNINTSNDKLGERRGNQAIPFRGKPVVHHNHCAGCTLPTPPRPSRECRDSLFMVTHGKALPTRHEHHPLRPALPRARCHHSGWLCPRRPWRSAPLSQKAKANAHGLNRQEISDHQQHKNTCAGTYKTTRNHAHAGLLLRRQPPCCHSQATHEPPLRRAQVCAVAMPLAG